MWINAGAVDNFGIVEGLASWLSVGCSTLVIGGPEAALTTVPRGSAVALLRSRLFLVRMLFSL